MTTRRLHLLCSLDDTRDWDEAMKPEGLFETREAMQRYIDDHTDPGEFVVDEDWFVSYSPGSLFDGEESWWFVFELPIYTTRLSEAVR